MTQVAPAPTFGTIGAEPADTAGPDFVEIQRSTEFTELRRRLRGFVFPVSALFFVWYLGYVLLAAYAHDFMSIRLAGLITVGLVLGLLQFVSTILITWWYLRFTRRQIDPRVAAIRASAGVRR